MRQLQFKFRNEKHREEAAKLAAGAINAVAAASAIGAALGPALNPALDWSWQRSLVLAVGAVLLHLMAQGVLLLGYPRPE